MSGSNVVPLFVARYRLGIPSRFAKLLRRGFLRQKPNGWFDLEELRCEYKRACSIEERLAEGARGLILEEEHRAAIASVRERLRQEFAEALATVNDLGRRQALEAAIDASMARVEIDRGELAAR
ncbi:hypothetical protein [Microvirga sp. BSC39]|uniref:hypothetical protein n=1 Tax=Microvirga sp. BSC39 TaxID=1549810 RepID=UPI0004E926DC|nr:hypothetical protein [Microvirga sp. BSC39]KFG71035.1 hypothetical protein JH26_00360 [Microvirga sp. BSC39]